MPARTGTPLSGLALWSAATTVLIGAALVATHPSTVLSAALDSAQQADTYTLAADRVAVYNLAGSIEVVEGDGPEVRVEVRRGGADADRLDVAVDRIRGRQTLRILYPSDRIIYPELDPGDHARVRMSDDGTFMSGDGRGFLDWLTDDRVEVRGAGSGLEAWADVVIRVPAGAEVATYLAAGETRAAGIRGELQLHSSRGGIRATDIQGFLSIDTGSGAAFVDGVDGDVDVDTGAGSVEIRRVVGDVGVDTGSGSVDVGEVRGERLSVDTGSGSVDGDLLEVETIDVDTGSGGVELMATTASRVGVDTGSGSVRVEFLEAVEDVDVETGSGRVELLFAGEIDAYLDIETGSGGIRSDLEMENVDRDRNDLMARVGSGAGRIRVDTGSGGVRLRRP